MNSLKYALASVLGVTSACALLTDLNSLGPADAGGDSGADASADAGACPSLHGPAMVQYAGVCIDSTPVTKAMYQEFVAAQLSVRTDGPCAFQTSYVPGTTPTGASWTTESTAAAAIGVNWCDARDYCEWAGKSLCGALDGGALVTASATGLTSQYHRVCSQAEAYHVPYGQATNDTPTDGYCDLASDAGPVAPGTFPKCDVGDAGIFDMLGNVMEWINACDEADAAVDDAGHTVAEAGMPNGQCAFVGGDWTQDFQFTDCTTYWTADRSASAFLGTGGIRCCNVPR